MGKTIQKSDNGKKRDATNERVRGAEKSPALKQSDSTLTVKGSLTEVKRKITSMGMTRDRHVITKIGLFKLGSWAQGLDWGVRITQMVKLMSGRKTYRKSTKTFIFLCSTKKKEEKKYSVLTAEEARREQSRQGVS